MTSFGGVFLALVNWRMFRSVEDSRSRVTALLAADMEKDLIRISEEMVLNLGSLKARERLYQELIGTAGAVTIEFAPVGVACAGGWRNSRDLSVYQAELRFDDLLVGCLKASVAWADNLATSRADSHNSEAMSSDSYLYPLESECSRKLSRVRRSRR